MSILNNIQHTAHIPLQLHFSHQIPSFLEFIVIDSKNNELHSLTTLSLRL